MAPPPDSDAAAANHRYFSEMVKVRNALVVPLTIVTIVSFFLLLTLTNFTSVLDGIAFSGITWAYLYSFALFFEVVILTTIYQRRMDAAEDRLRPAHLDETAAHYDDPDTWEHHEEDIVEAAHHIDELDRKEHGA